MIFFKVGGNSLKAVQLVSRISRDFSVHVQLTEIFLQPTIEKLAIHILSQEKSLLSSSIISIQQRPNQIPLSFSQERLWFIDQLEGSVQYNLSDVFRLRGEFNKEALEHALSMIVDRHEVLRTVILEEHGKPYQYIKEKGRWQLNVVDGHLFQNNTLGLKQYIDKLIREPFDLSKDDMIRAHLITLNNQEHVLVVTMHHIASDGWSLSIFTKELVELYGYYINERTALPEPLKLQYADYAIWQRQHLQGELLNKKISYWKEKLKGVSPLQLPTDYIRPTVQSTKGALKSFNIDKELSGQLVQLSNQQSTTLFMTLLAAFKTLMHRYSGQQDICVGTPVANRAQQELEELIGFFVNTLAIRSEVKSDASFIELLQQVKSTTLEAYEYQDVPFEKVVEVVVKERDLSRNPLFQVLLVMQNTPEVQEFRLGEVQLSVEGYTHETTKFDISIFFTETS
ncbi:MAG: condensation domain-containing protein [Chitinophagaceae bacterium]